MWIYSSWYIYKFTINDFTQPHIGDVSKAIERLRSAGLSAWDEVPDPDELLRELRQ